MRPARRLDRVEPYPFAQLERKIEEKQQAGQDVISLGIGDPVEPTPGHIVDAMVDSYRPEVDKLEEVVDDEDWPLVKYRELLFVK